MRTKFEISTLVEGRTYCFVNEENKTRFMKDPVVMRQKAETFYAKQGQRPQLAALRLQRRLQGGQLRVADCRLVVS